MIQTQIVRTYLTTSFVYFFRLHNDTFLQGESNESFKFLYLKHGVYDTQHLHKHTSLQPIINIFF